MRRLHFFVEIVVLLLCVERHRDYSRNRATAMEALAVGSDEHRGICRFQTHKHVMRQAIQTDLIWSRGCREVSARSVSAATTPYI